MRDIINIEALRQSSTRNIRVGTSAMVAGYYEPADGGGGLFVWTDDTTTNEDDGLVIFPNSKTQTGCWKRVFDGSINVKWFGAKGNGETDDSDAFERMFNIFSQLDFNYGIPLSAFPNSGQVRSFYIPTGTYLLKQTIGWTNYPTISDHWDKKRLPYDIRIVGDSRNASTLLFDIENVDANKLIIGIQAVDFPTNSGPDIHISHITVKNISVNNHKKVGLFANNGAYIYISDCNFSDWNSGIWYHGTENVTIERTGFSANIKEEDVIGIELGAIHLDKASTQVIAIRDCTFLDDYGKHIGIKATSCTSLDITGNFFTMPYSIELGNCQNVNIQGNTTEGGNGIHVTNSVATVNIISNSFNCSNFCMDVEENADVVCVSFINNVFYSPLYAIHDPYDKIEQVHLGANNLAAINDGDGTPLTFFKRSDEKYKSIASLDVHHSGDRNTFAFALKAKIMSRIAPFYSISGVKNPEIGPSVNYFGSTIEWLGSVSSKTPSESSGEIRYIRDFVYRNADSSWIKIIEHSLVVYSILHFELKGVVSDGIFSSGRSFLIKGMCMVSEELGIHHFSQSTTEELKSNQNLLPIEGIIQIKVENNQLVIYVKGNDYDQWLITLTITQKLILY